MFHLPTNHPNRTLQPDLIRNPTRLLHQNIITTKTSAETIPQVVVVEEEDPEICGAEGMAEEGDEAEAGDMDKAEVKEEILQTLRKTSSAHLQETNV